MGTFFQYKGDKRGTFSAKMVSTLKSTKKLASLPHVFGILLSRFARHCTLIVPLFTQVAQGYEPI